MLYQNCVLATEVSLPNVCHGKAAPNFWLELPDDIDG